MKSRETGVTWTTIQDCTHEYLFTPGFSVGICSLKEQEVDQIGGLGTCLEKVRFTLRTLPGWMLPKGYHEQTHAKFLNIVNPETRANIVGDSGDYPFVGHRHSMVIVDEAAKLLHSDTTDQSLSYVTNVQVDISTPQGTGNAFHRKVHSGAIPVFRFSWRDDPRKNWTVTGPDGKTVYPWFEKQKKLHPANIIASELEMDFDSSKEGIAIPAHWVQAAVELQLTTPAEQFQTPTEAGLDVAEEGENLSVLIPMTGPVAGTPLAWAHKNTTQSAHEAARIAREQGVVKLRYDCVGVGAGVRGTWESADTPLGFEPEAVNSGETPTDAVHPDGRTSKQMFMNLRAEMWWQLRRRFEKTWEFVHQNVKHPVDELISIPRHEQLILELSRPLHFYTETGKIKIESKKEMRTRGVKSPDFADALVYAAFRGPPKRKLVLFV